MIKNVEVLAASDIDLDKLKSFAKKFRIKKTFLNYLDLLEIKDLDLVDICTPTLTHAEIACNAAKYGKNALLEKPLALRIRECDEIINATKKYGVKLCVCHNQKFYPAIKLVKSLIDSGTIHPISFKTFVKENGEQFPTWITKDDKQGGILWEAGYHLAYLQLLFLKNIEHVYAIGNKVRYPVYDDITVLLRSKFSNYGIMEISWVSEGQEIFYELSCSDGKRLHIDRAHDYILERPATMPRLIRKWLNYNFSNKLRYFRGHFYLIQEFFRSIEKDLPSPVPPEEGRETIRLLEAIEESLSKKEIVELGR